MRVGVIGASGQLGSALCSALEEAQLECVRFEHGELEVSSPESVWRALRTARPNVVVNTAAFHHVDACEEDPARAFEVNALGALYVAQVCREIGVRCVYVSTDYVFDGAKPGPYSEEDAPNPINVYGASKLAGEHLVLQTCPDALVVRLASLYGGRGARGKHGNFVLSILERARRGEVLRVVRDVRMSPTYAADAARAIVNLVEDGATGRFHVVDEGACSWWEFARAIVALAGLNATVLPVSLEEYHLTKARRPVNSALSIAKLQSVSIRMPPWQEALTEYIDRILPTLWSQAER